MSIHAINKIKGELNFLTISFNIDKIKFLLNRFYLVFSIFLITVFLFSAYTLPAINRILNPKTVFKISAPFELLNITDDSLVFDGENKKISVAAIGEIPDSIILNYIVDEKINSIKKYSECTYNSYSSKSTKTTNKT